MSVFYNEETSLAATIHVDSANTSIVDLSGSSLWRLLETLANVQKQVYQTSLTDVQTINGVNQPYTTHIKKQIPFDSGGWYEMFY